MKQINIKLSILASLSMVMLVPNVANAQEHSVEDSINSLCSSLESECFSFRDRNPFK